MTIKFIYIYDCIISFLISHAYKKPYTCKRLFQSKKYITNYTEIINYCLVSKSWFKLVSGNLSIIYSKRNCEILNRFYDLNGDRPFKLVRNLRLFTKYNSLREYEMDAINAMRYKKVLIKIDNQDDSIEMLKYRNFYPENISFNISVFIDEYSKFFDYEYQDGVSTINKVKITGIDYNEIGLLGKIVALNPKKISYDPYSRYYGVDSLHCSYLKLFQSNYLKHIKVLFSDHIEPSEIANINNFTTSLKTLTIPILYHDIIRFVNDEQKEIGKNNCDDHESFFDIKMIEYHWNEMVNTLSNNSTIKELVLTNFCANAYCCYDKKLDTSFITYGLGLILTSIHTSIETLSLDGIDFYDLHLLGSLARSKTIKTLVLNEVNIDDIIKKVLTKNKTIRNIIIENILNLLAKYSSINLYSLSIKIFDQTYISNILEYIKLYSKFLPFKELNIFVESFNLKSLKPKINSQSINDIIINIYYNNKNKNINN
ncbi:hypothetical protein DICPUDRAFT_92641 [Dictyostelium purpureum]|uniref:Uncharacterized protein n=1 Tax=Dictyostelium purpureum TaxID=5786 RepID=F0ZUZ0_DICPU|nr:uncharacterized protein DICPUDRAFT_92641 [Dictyostelium purpureum]EGC32232.1 hypothetical protein DICPUDRAFT_92641 [Dictyostelium purpureum]|eukprot:XP_003291230.1 hypothetical protein DICPUDRAFT_92641 [Dictyostelium purpureum]